MAASISKSSPSFSSPSSTSTSSSSAITPLPSCSLVPVRVDVVSDDGSIRIVETMLWDPHCWPIPLTTTTTASSSSWHDAVEANVQFIAYHLLADLEVQGMTRTQRHFTGRVELWSVPLQSKLADQLRPQLWKIAQSVIEPSPSPTAAAVNHGSVASSNSEPPPATSSSSSSPSSPPLKDIPIRLDFNGIMIQDQVSWCNNVSTSKAITSTHPTPATSCPVAISKSITQDLHLPDDAAVAICTALVEQVHGITSVASSMDAAAAATAGANATDKTKNISDKRVVSGAWNMDQRDHLVKVNYVVAIHKPSTTATNTSTTTTTTASSTTTTS